MQRLVFCALVLGVLCFTSDVESSRGKGKGKIKQKLEDKESVDNELDDLKENLKALEARLDGGSCAGNNVHFYFHAGDAASPASDDDHNVNVYLNSAAAEPRVPRYAHAEFDGGADGVSGFVHMIENAQNAGVNFFFHFDHLGAADEDFPVHVHEFGDTSHGCMNIGGHYDPISDEYDVGDLGELDSDDAGGLSSYWINGTMLHISGSNSIIGRSIAIHDESGAKIACAPIVLSNEEMHSHDHDHGAHGHHGHDHP